MSLKLIFVPLIMAVWGAVAFAVVGGGDVEFQVTGAGPVVFSHERHVSSHFLACTDCHASPFVTKAQRKPVTMDQMAKGLSCGACHDGKRAFSVKENCQLCHQ